MNKPNDYDKVQEYTYNTPLEPGGYVCRIMQVQETTAQSSGAPMLKIGLEIAEGPHKGYFTEMFKNDSRHSRTACKAPSARTLFLQRQRKRSAFCGSFQGRLQVQCHGKGMVCLP